MWTNTEETVCENNMLDGHGYVNKDSTVPINLYNSNHFYKCSIYSKVAPLYEVCKNGIRFSTGKIDYKDVLSGDYLGESLYPLT